MSELDSTKDDLIIPFHLDGKPVRGRIVRLGPVLDDILQAHDLPIAVAQLLGEAVITSILAGSSLKFDGRVIVQASGDGPVSFLVSDYTSDGGVRGYIRYDEDKLPTDKQPNLANLLGKGQFALTIDPGKAEHRYQGIATLEPSSFAKTAETYFQQSEQLPSALAIAIARHTDKHGQTHWRGGGLLIQRIANAKSDEGDFETEQPEDIWDTARAFVATIGADELTDPMLDSERLLYRLFHEQGVRCFEPMPVHKRCTCTPTRLRDVLQNFPSSELQDMIAESGQIEMICEYCAKTFCFDPASLG
ncbi:MAG: Hsp33 family molecular chaperone [Robiginitomaculum sp.]|nr:MAG: Hsp33 family molecular chaperone [Robiginitomaculum sp.]